MDLKLITTLLLVALVVWGILRRVHRTFGRQPVRTVRIWLRIGVLTLVGGLVVVTGAAPNTDTFGAVISGFACGAVLAYVGLRHTRFEVTAEGRFYTPHTYIGVLVTALLIGRLAYRFMYLSYGANAPVGVDQNLAIAYQRSPLTLGIFALLIGYYVLFYSGVLVRTRVAARPMEDRAPPGT